MLADSVSSESFFWFTEYLLAMSSHGGMVRELSGDLLLIKTIEKNILTMPQGMWDLSSQARDQTHDPCLGNVVT